MEPVGIDDPAACRDQSSQHPTLPPLADVGRNPIHGDFKRAQYPNPGHDASPRRRRYLLLQFGRAAVT
jgi:hypothetical protein